MYVRIAQAIVAAALIFLGSGSSHAHPLGNFSISHYSAIRLGAEAVELRYIIDMAEIPTFQEIQHAGVVPKTGDPSLEVYLARKAGLLRESLTLEINGKRLPLQSEAKEIVFPPGAGGLPTLKIGIVYKAKLGADSETTQHLLRYRDGNFAGRAGWKEIIAVSEAGIKILNSSVPENSRSSGLSDYPTDLLNSPPQDLEARVSFTSSPMPAWFGISAEQEHRSKTADQRQTLRSAAPRPKETPPALRLVHAKTMTSSDVDAGSHPTSHISPVELQANRQATPRNSFTEFMAMKQLSLGMIAVALVVAVGLGAFHALEPGHGKTLVAAYLVGARGTMKHAFWLGLIVTAAHTAGVYLLGGVTLYASQYIVPDRLYPWLGIVSGVMITTLGLALLLRRCIGKDNLTSYRHHHSTDHAHGLSHHHHDHDHHHHTYREESSRQVSLQELLTLGISGGIVPCPAALVVLLSAVSMQRVGFGLLLIVAFSIGLAAVLIAIGLLIVYARQFMSRFQTNGQLVTRWLPLTSSAFIIVLGIALTLQALKTMGLLQVFL
jgi:ABC-type nickel/cobalt efflux system permease component RcnA